MDKINKKKCFSLGYIILPGGEKHSIPRYFERWLLKEDPGAWTKYITEVKPKIMKEAAAKHDADDMQKKLICMRYKGLNKKYDRYVTQRNYAIDIRKIQQLKMKEDKL